jgi:copper chaperone CopZ
MPGVLKVDASFISGTATITFDDEKITVDQIVKNYRNANFVVLGKPEMLK